MLMASRLRSAKKAWANLRACDALFSQLDCLSRNRKLTYTSPFLLAIEPSCNPSFALDAVLTVAADGRAWSRSVRAH